MAINFPSTPKCSVYNCGNPQVAKGFCDMHYRRLKKHGTVSDEVGKQLIDGQLASRHPLYETWRNVTRACGGTVVCEEWKNFAEFVKDAGDKPDNAYALKRIDSNGKFSLGNVRWAIRERDVVARMKGAEAQRKLREANPEYHKSLELKKKYGITLDDYNKILNSQNGVCAICSKPESRIDKRINRTSYLAVDHCHEAGKVRGLLCHHCNAMLGSARDSMETMQAGIDYLQKHLR